MRAIIVAAIITTAIIVGGCGGESKEERAAKELPSVFGAKSPTPCAGKINVRLERAVFASSIGEYVPINGGKFAVIIASASTGGTVPLDLKSSDFSLTDDAGRTYNEVGVYNATELLEGTVDPGRTLLGRIAFRNIPIATESVKLTFHGCGDPQEWAIP